MNPKTEAGRALVEGVSGANPALGLAVRDNVVVAEHQAVSAYRARLREKVASMAFHPHRAQSGHMDTFVDRAAVLALIDEED